MFDLLVDTDGPYDLVAISNEGRLCDIYVNQRQTSIYGNIYLGCVERVVPALQAAFLDIGLEKKAYLQADDVLACKAKEASDLSTILYPGMLVMVQVIRESIGDKGPRVTTDVNLTGNYAVYRPFGKGVAISRNIRIPNLKNKLEAIATKALLSGGLVVRTDAAYVPAQMLMSEISFLAHEWQMVQKANDGKGPRLLLKNSTYLAYISSWCNEYRPNRIFCSSSLLQEKLSSSIRGLIEDYNPQFVVDNYAVNEYARGEIDNLLKKRVALHSGGELVIEENEALTVIDVDSSSCVHGLNANELAVKINLEATVEIARQLRLRNIGGVVVIDFINMQDTQSRALVLSCLKEELSKDRVQTSCCEFSRLGLLEMSRHRTRESLGRVICESCVHCDGTGKQKKLSSLAWDLHAEIGLWVKKGVNRLRILCHDEIRNTYISIYGDKGELPGLDASWDELPTGAQSSFVVYKKD